MRIKPSTRVHSMLRIHPQLEEVLEDHDLDVAGQQGPHGVRAHVRHRATTRRLLAGPPTRQVCRSPPKLVQHCALVHHH